MKTKATNFELEKKGEKGKGKEEEGNVEAFQPMYSLASWAHTPEVVVSSWTIQWKHQLSPLPPCSHLRLDLLKSRPGGISNRPSVTPHLPASPVKLQLCLFPLLTLNPKDHNASGHSNGQMIKSNCQI